MFHLRPKFSFYVHAKVYMSFSLKELHSTLGLFIILP